MHHGSQQVRTCLHAHTRTCRRTTAQQQRTLQHKHYVLVDAALATSQWPTAQQGTMTRLTSQRISMSAAPLEGASRHAWTLCTNYGRPPALLTAPPPPPSPSPQVCLSTTDAHRLNINRGRPPGLLNVFFTVAAAPAAAATAEGEGEAAGVVEYEVGFLPVALRREEGYALSSSELAGALCSRLPPPLLQALQYATRIHQVRAPPPLGKASQVQGLCRRWAAAPLLKRGHPRGARPSATECRHTWQRQASVGRPLRHRVPAYLAAPGFAGKNKQPSSSCVLDYDTSVVVL